jgi:hypothetical protein
MSLRTFLPAAAVTAAALTLVAAQAAGAAGAHPAPPAPRTAPASAGASRPAATRPATHPNTSVTVVRPGQLVPVGHGTYLKLTADQRCVGAPGAWSCKSVTDGNQAEDSVSIQIQGDSDGTLYTPLYIGTGDAARMTVTDEGSTYEVQVVTLTGHPGYSTGYVWSPPGSPSGPGDTLSATVYDASGTVLATF